MRDFVLFMSGLDMFMNAPLDQWYRVARLYTNPQWKLLLEAMTSTRYFPILGYLILFPQSLLANVAKAIKEYTMVRPQAVIVLYVRT